LCCQVCLDEWTALWAPAEALFGADIVSSTLADITVNHDSVSRYSGSVQSRPLAEPLAFHAKTAAAVISSCKKSCVSLESFYDELW
jgi:hypothetical protein